MRDPESNGIVRTHTVVDPAVLHGIGWLTCAGNHAGVHGVVSMSLKHVPGVTWKKDVRGSVPGMKLPAL